jgi:hypothetical protein
LDRNRVPNFFLDITKRIFEQSEAQGRTTQRSVGTLKELLESFYPTGKLATRIAHLLRVLIGITVDSDITNGYNRIPKKALIKWGAIVKKFTRTKQKVHPDDLKKAVKNQRITDVPVKDLPPQRTPFVGSTDASAIKAVYDDPWVQMQELAEQFQKVDLNTNPDLACVLQRARQLSSDQHAHRLMINRLLATRENLCPDDIEGHRQSRTDKMSWFAKNVNRVSYNRVETKYLKILDPHHFWPDTYTIKNDIGFILNYRSIYTDETIMNQTFGLFLKAEEDYENAVNSRKVKVEDKKILEGVLTRSVRVAKILARRGEASMPQEEFPPLQTIEPFRNLVVDPDLNETSSATKDDATSTTSSTESTKTVVPTENKVRVRANLAATAQYNRLGSAFTIPIDPQIKQSDRKRQKREDTRLRNVQRTKSEADNKDGSLDDEFDGDTNF